MSDESKKKPGDPIQEAMGELGRWQIFVCAIIFLLKFPVAWHQLSIIFLGPNLDFTCSDPQLDRCDKSCNGHVFDNSTFTNTIQMEWDLVCERKSLANMSQTIFMFGILVGNMVFGAIADKMGRRNPLVIAVIMQLIFGVSTSFVTNFWLFVIFRFLTAAATGGTMLTS
jgi:MFS family permease